MKRLMLVFSLIGLAVAAAAYAGTGYLIASHINSNGTWSCTYRMGTSASDGTVTVVEQMSCPFTLNF